MKKFEVKYDDAKDKKYIEVDGVKYYYHHDACRQGYIRVGESGGFDEYEGRFGVGYTRRFTLTTMYHLCAYYIKEED